MAETSDTTLSAIRESSAKLDTLHRAIADTTAIKAVAGKLDEVKSASLIANRLLKDISSFEAPTEMKVKIVGAELVAIKGPKGDKGDKGNTGAKGEKGDQGEQGDSITGVKGDKGDKGDFVQGPKGEKGERGEQGLKGDKGESGRDAPPLDSDEVMAHLNASKKSIDPKRVRGLPDALKVLDQFGTNPQGHYENVGGSNPLILLSNGVRVSDFVTEINFSTNITAVYSGSGRVTLTATGGGSATYSETPSGLVNGSNTTYTTVNAITTVINLTINGQFIHPAEYVVAGAGFTMGTALDSSLSGKGFTIVYS